MLIKREIYWEKIKPFIDKPVIKVITGMRRIGKSYFLKQIIEELKNNNVTPEQVIFIDMEDLEFDFIKNYKDLYEYIKSKSTDIKSKNIF